MEWSAAGTQVLEHRHGSLQVSGGPGTGRTFLLVERWRRRAQATRHPERLLVLCRSRQAADRFRDAALVGQTWAAEQLAFSTFFGAAFDLVRRHRGERRLLSRAEQWSVVRRLLLDDTPRSWPSCPDLVHRAAFVDEVSAAVLAMEASGAAEAAILSVADHWGQGPRWQDVIAFRHRYRQATDALGALDEAQLLTAAADVLSDASVATAEAQRWDEVLVDDGDVATAAMGALVDRLEPSVLIAAGGVAVPLVHAPWPRWRRTTAWDQVARLDHRYRASAVPEALVCRHPSVEPEEIAATLLAARSDGVAWGQMAVLLRRPTSTAQSVGRLLARYGIPAVALPTAFDREPAVRAIIDFFAWASGDEAAFDRLLVSPAVDLAPAELRWLRRRRDRDSVAVVDHPRVAALLALREEVAPRVASASPGDLVHAVWAPLLGGMVPDPGSRRSDPAGNRALDSVTAYLAAVSRRSSHDPTWRMADELALADGPDLDAEPWAPAPLQDADRVSISTIWTAGGRSWDVVVVPGCLEGEFPHLSGTTRFFDDAVITHAVAEGASATATAGAPTLAQRRQASLERERRLFELASTRARGRLVLTAGPAPGQTVSRFLSGVAPAPPAVRGCILRGGGTGPAPLEATEGLQPVFPSRRLELSASRLMLYDDCPLRYFYRYVVGVQGPGGVAASMGTVVHAALAEFLDPTQHPDASGADDAAGPGGHSWPALEAIGRRLWEDEGWGATIAPYQPMREQARRDVFTMLQSWWDTESAAAGAAGAWPDVVAVEYPFEIEVGDHRVRGYIDRIDRVEGGLAIVDYKTGAHVMPAAEAADDLQLATYHLAVLRDPALASLGPPVSLELWYLRSGVAVGQPIAVGHAERTEQRIIDAAERILAEAFDPSVEADCEHCEFHRLCPLQIRGRHVVGE
jgi:putative RecB family exonuclease